MGFKPDYHNLELGLASLSFAGLGFSQISLTDGGALVLLGKWKGTERKLPVVSSKEVLVTSWRSLYRLSHFSLSESSFTFTLLKGRCSEGGVWSDPSARTASLSFIQDSVAVPGILSLWVLPATEAFPLSEWFQVRIPTSVASVACSQPEEQSS